MKKSTKKEVYSWMKSIAIAVFIAFMCRQFLFTPLTVHGVSMEPTFDDNNRIVISKTSTTERFDMIVFKAPDAVDTQYIKRVIGLPGDNVEMKDDVLFINGKQYEEPYVKRDNEIELGKVTGDFTLQELTGHTTVPNGYLFVLGDNRLKSNDSRAYGFISTDSVIGEVKLRFYPVQKTGIPK
ncbi:signal peptidase I [Sporosarcina sp. BI001-red]|uniref:signal peptidase I n=1 Tax=Sporosarcina sp. BI001-red TaxID=2282866 RepID=UPI0026D9AB0D|nr:signal peptidase I [Sporosarcina sp. BI001-red]